MLYKTLDLISISKISETHSTFDVIDKEKGIDREGVGLTNLLCGSSPKFKRAFYECCRDMGWYFKRFCGGIAKNAIKMQCNMEILSKVLNQS